MWTHLSKAATPKVEAGSPATNSIFAPITSNLRPHIEMLGCCQNGRIFWSRPGNWNNDDSKDHTRSRSLIVLHVDILSLRWMRFCYGWMFKRLTLVTCIVSVVGPLGLAVPGRIRNSSLEPHCKCNVNTLFVVSFCFCCVYCVGGLLMALGLGKSSWRS